MEAARATTETVIEPQQGWRFPDFKEAWAYRDLLFFLARRDVVVRYRQAVIGVFWAVLQPIILATVFAVFLGLVAKLDGPPGVPYALFAVVGMVLWIPFTDAVTNASESALTNETLISKIYFPRILIPVAAIVPGIVDFCFGFVVALIVAAAYGYYPGPELLAVPIVVFFTFATALGAGLLLSALNVRYRDIHLLIPLVILTGLFVTPILYPLEQIEQTTVEWVQPIYALNPMVGVMEAFRWCVLGTPFPGFLIFVPIVTSIVLLVTGALYYERAQRTFADVI